MNKLILLLFSISCFTVFAQDKEEDKSAWSASTFSGLKFRSVGPAFFTGRIADIAIHPEDESVWYIAVGSGGVWKTTNAGTTFDPVFDSQKVFSIGCVTIDPNNPNRVWVGTGENTGGRHSSWGDGIYLSEDAGKSWKNMGLKRSEHLSKIIVHPDNSNVVWVASQGPLWSKGGERGLYKSTDGGKTWKRTLGNDQWTGATDLLIDPRNPERLYCATWDRHRTVAAYMGGGPGSGLHRSEDGGETWTELKSGLPSVNMGKIGLAISPQQPDVIYAAIEEELRKGGVYKSTDRGASWKKMSDAVAGGTGPHYYQELYASPHEFDRIYLANNYLLVSDNGGKDFNRVKGESKHVDDHAMAFKMSDPDYIMVGTDGGLYESFDLAQNWRHFGQLPITQFYKIAVDDAEPFYNIYGGTQDNSTQGGPSRTDNRTGIQNGDWVIVNGGDGHQPATEPGNPDIIYAQSQQGYLARIDIPTGERVSVRPQPKEGEVDERYNWDAPILVSAHDPKRLYFASQRLWRSDDRGDNWTAISEDLSRNENRLELPIMGRKQSYNNPWDVYAMSNYNSITSLAESPLDENKLYAGTDDGQLWTSADGGANWKKKEVGSISGVPTRAFVNDIKADLFDANTAYLCMDNHKYGDYRSFLYKTTDGGKSWKSIDKGLPDTTLVWRIVQDHIDKNLLFVGTEFGIYFSHNGGGEWTQLKGGLPPISFRDLAIQRRENDLVCASFGRSLYILDDYSALRNLEKSDLEAAGKILPMRAADWYQERSILPYNRKGWFGTGHYVADNPPFGAVISYHIKEGFTSKKAERTKREKELIKNNQDVPFPGYKALEAERLENGPIVWLSIYDSKNKLVRRIEAAGGKGIHRVAWDLRTVSPYPVREGEKGKEARPSGHMVEPGKYRAELSRMHNGELENLGEALDFDVVELRKSSIEGAGFEERLAFWEAHGKAMSDMTLERRRYDDMKKKVATLKEVIIRSGQGAILPQMKEIEALESAMEELSVRVSGIPSRDIPGEKNDPTVYTRLWSASGGSSASYGPTGTARESLSIAQKEIDSIRQFLDTQQTRIEKVEREISDWNRPGYR